MSEPYLIAGTSPQTLDGQSRRQPRAHKRQIVLRERSITDRYVRIVRRPTIQQYANGYQRRHIADTGELIRSIGRSRQIRAHIPHMIRMNVSNDREIQPNEPSRAQMSLDIATYPFPWPAVIRRLQLQVTRRWRIHRTSVNHQRRPIRRDDQRRVAAPRRDVMNIQEAKLPLTQRLTRRIQHLRHTRRMRHILGASRRTAEPAHQTHRQRAEPTQKSTPPDRATASRAVKTSHGPKHRMYAARQDIQP